MQFNNRAGQLLDLAQKVYPFAYSLLNDEVSAYQLVVDSLSRIELDNNEEMSFHNLCRFCFELSKKAPPLTSTKSFFNQLSLEEKAILFLKEKEGMSFSEISKILAINSVNVHSGLSNARNSLFELMGTHY